MDGFGSPDLSIGPIRLLTLGRLPGPTADPWWVDEIVCRTGADASGLRIVLAGQIPSRNFQFFLSDLQSVYDSLEGKATLDGSDLGLVISIKALPLGHMSVSAEFWPSGLWDGPLRANFQLDQTDLRPILSACRTILDKFPVKADRGLL
jgi:hypothetical protein